MIERSHAKVGVVEIEEEISSETAEQETDERLVESSRQPAHEEAFLDNPGDPALFAAEIVGIEEHEDVSAVLAEDISPEEAARVRLAIRAASLSEERVRTICESLLFIADRPLTVNAIQDATGLDPRRIREAMEELGGRFREGVSGLVLHEVAGGWQLRTCPTNVDEVRRFLRVRPQRLTRPALETLAIIAYRQPVTRPEIEEIRGVDCGAVLKALLDRGIIQVIGKKEEPGRPLIYATTRAFLEFFNLKDLASLPTLRELHELTEESERIVEESFPDEVGTERGLADLVDKALSGSVDESRTEDEAAIEDLESAVKLADGAVRTSIRALKVGDSPKILGEDEELLLDEKS